MQQPPGRCGSHGLACFEVDCTAPANLAAHVCALAIAAPVVGVPHDAVALLGFDGAQVEVVGRAQAGGACACIGHHACDDV